MIGIRVVVIGQFFELIGRCGDGGSEAFDLGTELLVTQVYAEELALVALEINDLAKTNAARNRNCRQAAFAAVGGGVKGLVCTSQSKFYTFVYVPD